MVGAFQDLREGRFEVRLHHRANDEFRYLYGAFNDTVGQLKASMDRVIEQERLISSAELAQLQSQIDPHFLYNSFFIISRMAKSEDYEQIDSFVTSLARYYRFINKTRQDVIPLAEEAEHMRNYADILQMRFGDVISIRVQEVPDPFRGLPVPKLILQPLIENAYEHGVKDKPGDGLIQVSYQCEEGELHILIEDNGELAEAALSSAAALIKAEDEKQKAHALYNIHRRLRLCCGAGAGLDIRRSSLGGFAALVRIPLGDKLIKK